MYTRAAKSVYCSIGLAAGIAYEVPSETGVLWVVEYCIILLLCVVHFSAELRVNSSD